MTWIFDNSKPSRHMVQTDTELMTFAEALTAHGVVSSQTVRTRISQGWDVEKAFKTPDESANNWASMSTRAKITLVKSMADKGMFPEAMANHIVGADARKLAIFCGNHGIGYGYKKQAVERYRRDAGPAIHNLDIDPKTKPSPDGVHFLETNMHTCKWPMWEVGAKPEERMCCGAHTLEGKPYCEFHSGRASIAASRRVHGEMDNGLLP